MPFKFENLAVWQKAIDLTININDLAKNFPPFEMYALSSQIRRAADSVVLNTAEGSTGQSNPEFSRFLGYATRSAIEVVSCLFIAKRKGYIEDAIFQQHYYNFEVLCKMLTKLKSTLVQ